MSITRITQVFSLEGLTLAERHLLVVLSHHSDNKTGECWPSVGLLAKKAKLSRRHVQRCLRRFQELGLMTVALGGGRGRRSGYVVHIKGDISDAVSLQERATMARTKGDIHAKKGRHSRQSPYIIENRHIEPSKEPSSGDAHLRWLQERYERGKETA